MTDTLIADIDGVPTAMTEAEHEAEYGPRGEEAPGVPNVISDRQFWQQLAILGDITRDEAKAAVKTGTLPAVIQAAVDAIPDPDTQFAVDMLLSGAVSFERNNPMVPVLGALLKKTSADLDAIWIAAALL